jgi:integrase
MAPQSYGAGSLSKKATGVWRLRVMVNGKQVQRTFRGSEAAARKALRELDFTDPATTTAPTAPRRSSAKGGSGLTFGEFLDKWMAKAPTLKDGWAPKTTSENQRLIDNRIKPELGDIPLAKLTGEHLDDAYNKWLKEGLSGSSVHRHHAVISSALSQAVKWKHLADTPARQASPPSARSEKKLVTPTADVVAKLIQTAQGDDPVMAAAVALAFVTGARRGELCALRWSDIDLDDGIVRIERSLSEVGEKLETKKTKTNRDRMVALDERSVALLRHHRAWQETLADKAGSPLVSDPYVLSENANGARPLAPSKATDRFTALRKAAKVTDVRFHDLRHAHVSELLHSGVDVTTVAKRVGHASTRMTLDVYSHALPAGDVAAAKVIGGLLPEVAVGTD